MALTGRSGDRRVYVGFGFGAIQAGLFLHEAHRSGAFGRLVVAEVVPEVVAAVRAAGGAIAVNVAAADHLEQVTFGPVEIENPLHTADRGRLIAAIAEADEIGTAVPSVRHYISPGPGSLHRVLAAGLRAKIALGGPAAVIYAAENHNEAAEILEEAVLAELPAAERAAVRGRVRFLNTVIGKMSGVVTDAAEIARRTLRPVTPDLPRAFLVESFNRILVSQVRFESVAGEPPYRRGIAVFEEKADLLPFEEAKLYGHNATHALAAYVGALAGVERIADLPTVPGALALLRAAFIEESGAALIRKYAGADPLFTPTGYAAYADDLLARMINPYLGDSVERVARDPQRKLGWDDRLIGTIRLALGQGIQPRRYAFGAAAALVYLDPAHLERSELSAPLDELWHDASPDVAERAAVLAAISEGLRRLRDWRAGGCLDPAPIF